MSLSKLRSKVLKFEDVCRDGDCEECIATMNSKTIYDIWMDIFVLIKRVCDDSLSLSRSCYDIDIAYLDDTMKLVIDIIDKKLVLSTMPDLFKVCLEQYLPNYISLLNGVECLDSLHSKVLLLKGKVIPSPCLIPN